MILLSWTLSEMDKLELYDTLETIIQRADKNRDIIKKYGAERQRKYYQTHTERLKQYKSIRYQKRYKKVNEILAELNTPD